MSISRTINLSFSCALFALTCWGCSSSNSDAPSLNANGKHPANWIEQHFVEFRRDRAQCVPCHGSATDRTASGGISGVSCFSSNQGVQSCHADGPAGHPVGWEAASQHGATAKAAPGTSSGFASCSQCHGSTYDNGAARSCLSCHTLAPHPDKPWHGTTASGTNHVTTDLENAAECAKCHRDGRNLTTIAPPPLQPAATASGCFNNTLCHGTSVGHPIGWQDPASTNFHGLTAKAASSSSSGFGYCQTCHGVNFSGVGAAVSCFSASVNGFNCHNGGLVATTPHPSSPWQGARTHTTTNSSNALYCDPCHRNGINSTRQPNPPALAGTAAGCFNNTLCHGSDIQSPHPVGGLYLPASQHGADAINKNNNSSGLTTCQTCHATPGTGSNPRFNVPRGASLTAGCESCHTVQTAHPTPWLTGKGTTRGNANQLRHSALAALNTAGSVVTNYCTLCHGTNLDGIGGVAPSCISGTSRLNIPGVASACHFSAVAIRNSQTGQFNLQTGCISCHGNPPTGTSSPNRDDSHTEHHSFFASAAAACRTCHNGLGLGTPAHANGTPNVSLASSYQAKTGGALAFTASTRSCANIRCHGGQTTPSWNEANPANLISVDTQCTKCHRNRAASDQYNSYFSGRHGDHDGIACTACHDTVKLRNNGSAPHHFSNLSSAAFEQHPRLTITFTDSNNSVLTNWTYNATTHVYTCSYSCHGEGHGTRTWTGSP